MGLGIFNLITSNSYLFGQRGLLRNNDSNTNITLSLILLVIFSLEPEVKLLAELQECNKLT